MLSCEGSSGREHRLTNPVKVLGRARMAAASEKCASSFFCKSLYRTLYGKVRVGNSVNVHQEKASCPWTSLLDRMVIFTWVLAFASCPPRASPRSVDQRANERGQSVQAQSFQSLRPPVVAVTYQLATFLSWTAPPPPAPLPPPELPSSALSRESAQGRLRIPTWQCKGLRRRPSLASR